MVSSAEERLCGVQRPEEPVCLSEIILLRNENFAESFGCFTVGPVPSSSHHTHRGEVTHGLARCLSESLFPGKELDKSFQVSGRNSQVLTRDQREEDISVEPVKSLPGSVCWPPGRISPGRWLTCSAPPEAVQKQKWGFGDPRLFLTPGGSSVISARGDLK